MARIDAPAAGVGRGKLILFGEHAAVYGHPAVGIPLDLETTATAVPGRRGGVRLPGLGAEDRAAVLRVAASLGVLPEEALTLRISSTVPRGAGFGSSAALCVALAAALTGARQPYGRELWELAHRAEAIFHGTPSGIDTGLALLEGMRVFRPRPPGLPDERRLPDTELHLVVGSVPRGASTGALVAGMRTRMAAGDRQAVEAIAELGALAEAAERCMRPGSEALAAEIGGLADRAHGVLARLGLSSPATDRILARGRELGALGGKLSGAGGGGAFYLVIPDAERARRIAAALAPEVPWVRPLAWSAGAAAWRTPRSGGR